MDATEYLSIMFLVPCKNYVHWILTFFAPTTLFPIDKLNTCVYLSSNVNFALPLPLFIYVVYVWSHFSTTQDMTHHHFWSIVFENVLHFLHQNPKLLYSQSYITFELMEKICKSFFRSPTYLRKIDRLRVYWLLCNTQWGVFRVLKCNVLKNSMYFLGKVSSFFAHIRCGIILFTVTEILR